MNFIKKSFSIFLISIIPILNSNFTLADEKFFEAGVKFYKEKKFDKAQFMFEKSIVFNPKDSDSYLYLAKIFNEKEDQRKEEKNLEATLLIEPDNEEAILMLMKIALVKSNYSKVDNLSKTFSKVCKKLCDEKKGILETLANIEPKNES